MSNLAAAQRRFARCSGSGIFVPGRTRSSRGCCADAHILPTGSGRSLSHQLPALRRANLTVVVSPLIALMRNQVAQRNGSRASTHRH